MLTMRKIAAVFAATASTVLCASSYGADVREIDVSLVSTKYVKIMENTGPLAGTWSLEGITAWNGAAQVAFACTSNRPYASATNGGGAMPAGSYVHQLSVFNQWDGQRTRSYRVMIAQPVGGNDIYARITAVTISKEGVNLVDCPDPRNFEEDSTKIEASYIAEADIAKFSVTKLRLARQTGYVESKGDDGACVNTGVYPGRETRIELDFELTGEWKLNDDLFGSYGENKNHATYGEYPNTRCYVGSKTATFDPANAYISYNFSRESCTADTKYQGRNAVKVDGERHCIVVDFTENNINGKRSFEYWTDGVCNYTDDLYEPYAKKSPFPLSIFGYNFKNSGHETPTALHGAPKMKVYGCRVYSYGTLVKNFTPCVKNGFVGFMETCSGVFVRSKNLNALTSGGDIREEPDYAHIDIGDRLHDGTLGQSLYLSLPYAVGPKTRIELDYSILTNTISTSPFLFSAYGGSGKNMELWIHQGYYAYTINGSQVFGSDKIGNLKYVPVDGTAGVRRTASMNNNSLAIITANWTNAVVTSSSALATTLGTMNVGARSNFTRYLPLRVYGVRYYEDNELVRNYIPIVTNGVPGMVDVKGSGIIYPCTHKENVGNGKQSVVAKAGGTIACTDGSDEAYLEFPGTGSGLDTGYKVTPRSCIEADFSLYDTYKLAAGTTNRYELLNQDSGTYVFLAAAVTSSGRSLYWAYCDYPASGLPSSADSRLEVSNDRRQYTFDSHNGKVAFNCGDQSLFTADMTGTRNRTDGAARNLIIGRQNAYMRLYGLKIWEYVNSVKTLVRDFVPCVTNDVAGLYELQENKFYPLAGGKVSGKGSKSAESFVAAPQSTKIKVDGSGTLTCFAPSAKSYEWYMDGEKFEGETGESLTIAWTKAKPRVRTVSVVPVYEVFGEAVKGKPAEAQVEFNDLGLMIIVR